MINVTKPYLPSQNRYQYYLDQIFQSGLITNNGPLLKTFEKRLQDKLGVKHVILVTNGSLALQTAYKALELKGEVITTPFSFVATTSTLVWEHLKPVFCDIDKNSLTMDTEKIEGLITPQTSAILPTHVFGNANEIENIESIAKKHQLKTIYDASHCFDTNYHNQTILNHGDISTISFHATKLFHTIEGGAIITKDDELAKKIRLFINFGFEGPEKISQLGVNAKMNEFQAAMGLSVLDELDFIKEKREKIWSFYHKNLQEHVQLIHWHKHVSMNHGYFPIILKDESTLVKMLTIFKDKKIYPRRYFYPSLNQLPYLDTNQSCPISEDICKRILCIPLYPDLLLEEAQQIVTIIKDNS